MEEKRMTFAELQEIIFWQQLNKQLIEARDAGQDIKDENQKLIQNFSFNNLLFSKITSIALLDEVPMALITDFSNIGFITLNLGSWNESLTQLIPNTHILDIERALADSFDALRKYDKQYYQNQEMKDNDKDDEDLYAFIDEYLSEREKHNRDIGRILQEIYKLKDEVIGQISQIIDYKPYFVIQESHAFFDLRTCNKKHEIMEQYSSFCKRIVSAVEPVIFPFGDMDIIGLLSQKQDDGNSKPSIREFVDHELSIVQRESDLLRTILRKANEKIGHPESDVVDVCYLSPFFFLDSPFPLI